MRILIDCDGVLSNFAEHIKPLCPELAALLNDEMSCRTVAFHHLFKSLSKEEEERAWERIEATPGWVESMPAYPGTAERLTQLREIGEVIAVTSPAHTSRWAHERSAWLMRHGFTKRTIVQTTRKSIVHGNVFIDDNPLMIDDWWEEQARIGSWQPRAAVLWAHASFADAKSAHGTTATHFKTVLSVCENVKAQLSHIRKYISAP
jgi:5'(3')-deoxyribonucleotidase